MNTFRVLIVGGEGTQDYPRFKKKCVECLRNKAKEGSIMIYTAGDRYVEAFAERFGLGTRFFPCDFKRNGKDALKIRAEEMLEDCDAVIVFNDGKKDTRMIQKLASEKGLPMRNIK